MKERIKIYTASIQEWNKASMDFIHNEARLQFVTETAVFTIVVLCVFIILSSFLW